MVRGTVFLMYHELEVPGRALCQRSRGYMRYVVPKSAFIAQMKWLIESGWRGLTVTEALDKPDTNSVAITFDDGCETDSLGAAPVLLEIGFRATFYATAGWIGRPGYLGPAQLRELHASGFEVGCHSMTHAYLDDLDENDLQREIVDSKKKLEDILGAEVRHFSCPGGRFDRRAIQAARRTGYRSLATSYPHENSCKSDRFRLGRVAVLRGMAEGTFGRICRGNLWQMRGSDALRTAAKWALGNDLYEHVRSTILGRPDL